MTFVSEARHPFLPGTVKTFSEKGTVKKFLYFDDGNIVEIKIGKPSRREMPFGQAAPKHFDQRGARWVSEEV